MIADARVRAKLTLAALGTCVIRRGSVVECLISTPHARLTVVADTVDPDTLVGAEATLELTLDGETLRKFPLRVWTATYVGGLSRQLTYELDLRHPLAWLSLRSSHRSWVALSAQEIVKKVLDGASLTPTFKLGRTLADRPFESQYGEPDLDFCWRLLEEEGVFLRTEEDGKLTFLDDASSARPFEGDGELPIVDDGRDSGASDVRMVNRLVPNAVCLRDEDRAKPGVDLTARANAADAPVGELFSFPGGFATAAEGKVLAKIRLEEQIARSCRLSARTDRPTMAAGYRFTLSGANLADLDKDYFVLSVEHRLGTEAAAYDNRVVASPAALPYHPPRVHRRPTVAGIHSGEVTTQQEKIHTDAAARATVHLHWDSRADSTHTSSSWMPVVQPLVASATFLARAGWDVGVRYADGRLDRPLVVGRLYLGRDAMPVTLPDDKTVTSYATRTADGGAQRNGFRIDDKKDAELFTVEAGKDYDAVVEHDCTETIVGGDTLTVGKRRVVVIDGSLTRTITGDTTLDVKKDAGLSVAGALTDENGGARKVTVQGAVATKISGNDTEKNGKARSQRIEEHGIETTSGAYALTVHGDASATISGAFGAYVDGAATEKGGGGAKRVAGKTLTLTVGGNAKLSSTGPTEEDVQGDLIVTSAGALSLEAALATWKATGKLQIKAKKVTIQADTAITITAGGGTVSISPAGVTIVGLLTAEATGNLEVVGAVHLVG